MLRTLLCRPDGNSSKRECAGCEGSRVTFFSLFALSGRVQFLEGGEGCTNDSLSGPDYPT